MKSKLTLIIAIVIASMSFASCLVTTPGRGGGTYYQRSRGNGHGNAHGHGHHGHHGRGPAVIVR